MGNASLPARIPVLRLLVPFIAGIIAFSISQSLWLPVTLVLVALAAAIVLLKGRNNPSVTIKNRPFHIVPIACVAALIGWIASWVAEPPQLDLNVVNGKVACARVETIKYNEQSQLMQVKLLSVDGDESIVRSCHALLSTRGCDFEIVPGHLIAFNINLKRVRNLGNPDEMDYASYLHDRGIIYRQHISVDKVAIVGTSPTLLTRAFNLREKLQHKVLNSALSPESQSLIIAMLLGNDDFIEPIMRDSFSQAGVAHVLALSGLHVAIITLLIWFLLFPLDYVRGKKIRLILTLMILVAYDVLTGLSPSVIRATVMMAFVFMSQIFYRKATPLNSMATAALAILIFSPFSLYNVGFQLSFITVTALIVFYQLFDIKFPRNKIISYTLTTLTTSLVAMVSTLALTAYYFNTVTVMAAVANLLIMPLIPVLMVLGAVALVLLAAGSVLGPIVKLIDWVTQAINYLTQTMASLTTAPSLYVPSWAVIVYYVIIVLLVLWLYKRNARYLLGAGASLVLGMACWAVQDALVARRGMVIFNSYNSTPVMYFNNGNALLWVPDVDSDFDVDNFKLWNRAFIAHHGIDSITLVDSSRCELPGAIIDHPHANVLGVGIVSAGKGRWKRYTRTDSVNLNFDIALITKGFHSNVATLKSLVECDSIVLSGGIYEEDNALLEQECITSKVPHYNIRLSGAYVMME